MLKNSYPKISKTDLKKHEDVKKSRVAKSLTNSQKGSKIPLYIAGLSDSVSSLSKNSLNSKTDSYRAPFSNSKSNRCENHDKNKLKCSKNEKSVGSPEESLSKNVPNANKNLSEKLIRSSGSKLMKSSQNKENIVPCVVQKEYSESSKENGVIISQENSYISQKPKKESILDRKAPGNQIEMKSLQESLLSQISFNISDSNIFKKCGIPQPHEKNKPSQNSSFALPKEDFLNCEEDYQEAPGLRCSELEESCTYNKSEIRERKEKTHKQKIYKSLMALRSSFSCSESEEETEVVSKRRERIEDEENLRIEQLEMSGVDRREIEEKKINFISRKTRNKFEVLATDDLKKAPEKKPEHPDYLDDDIFNYSATIAKFEQSQGVKSKHEKADLQEMIRELRNKLKEKDSTIIELKRGNVVAQANNERLKIHLSEMNELKGYSQSKVDKLKSHIEAQDREVETLKECKQKLQESIRTRKKMEAELKEYADKIVKYEKVVEVKRKEVSTLKQNIEKAEKKADLLRVENIDLETQACELREEITEQEIEIQNLMEIIESGNAKAEEHRLVEIKLEELGIFQDQLMEENDMLEQQIQEQEEKEKRTKEEEEEIINNVKHKLSVMLSGLKDLDNDYVQKLVTIVKAMINENKGGVEKNLEADFELEELLMVKKVSKEVQDDFQDVSMKKMSQQIVNIVEAMNRKFEDCEDKINNNYASKWSNECNVQ